MRSHALLFLPLALTGLVLGQERVPALDESAPEDAPRPDEAQLPRTGPGLEFPTGPLDDSIPLPVAATGVVGEGGDVRGDDASGDPYFLGFIAGNHYPPEGERIDPLLIERAGAAYDGNRPSEETYAFVMFEKRITAERRAKLEQLGARVLGFHPHYTLKVALPPTSIDTIASQDFVRWIGVPRDAQKVHPALTDLMAKGTGEPLEVWINVFDSDLGTDTVYESIGTAAEADPEGEERAVQAEEANLCLSFGWQHTALAERGVEVLEYVDSVRALRCRVPAAEIPALVQLDHVQFIEPVFAGRLFHDESIPMVNADRTRNAFDGGANDRVVVGIVDSGLENSHFGLNHIYMASWNMSNGSSSFDDGCRHGSHVAGTLLGLPPASGYAGYTGVAPGLGGAADRRVFNIRLFEDNCDYGTGSLAQVLGRLDGPWTDSNGNTTPTPHIVNQSWGSDPVSGGFAGSETSGRLLDAQIRDLGQLHVFAIGNDGSGTSTLSVQAAAKNTLSVGNVLKSYSSFQGYPGSMRSTSSRGPCFDGRWKPTMSAPGTGIWSVDSATQSGYRRASGTSMAAPHVAGVAAQMIDSFGFYEYRAAALSAALVVGSVSDGNEVIDNPNSDAAHLNSFGAGRLDATRSLYHYPGQSELSVYHWNRGPNGYQTVDVTVGPNATRMVVAMVYHEEAASSGASSALVNDLDLWIDRAPFTSGGNTGEFFIQQSDVDNVEVRMIENPSANDYRIKIFPDSFPGTANVKVGLAVKVIYGDTTPDANVTLTANKTYAQLSESVEFTCEVNNPGAVASSVFLESGSGINVLTGATTTLLDGTVTDLTRNETGGEDILLGNIRHNSTRRATWTTHFLAEGTRTWLVQASSDNMLDETVTAQVIVDSTGPVGPTNVQSTTHTPGAGSCSQSFTMTWTPATDVYAGLAGYRVEFTESPTTVPDGPMNATPAVTTFNTTLGLGRTWWAHVRPRDNGGNWGDTVHLGPFQIGSTESSVYCTSNPNSTGSVGQLGLSSGSCWASGQLVFRGSQLPPGQFGYMIMSPTPDFVPLFAGSQGNLCVASPIYRFIQGILQTDASGQFAYTVDLDNLPQGVTIDPGEEWHWQFWSRDFDQGPTSNTTNAVRTVFR